jgi:hypothetical protein
VHSKALENDILALLERQDNIQRVIRMLREENEAFVTTSVNQENDNAPAANGSGSHG